MLSDIILSDGIFYDFYDHDNVDQRPEDSSPQLIVLFFFFLNLGTLVL